MSYIARVNVCQIQFPVVLTSSSCKSNTEEERGDNFFGGKTSGYLKMEKDVLWNCFTVSNSSFCKVVEGDVCR